MAETIVNNRQCSCEEVAVDTVTEETKTITTTQNCQKNTNETITQATGNILIGQCPCGRFDLDRLAEESRCCAFKSSNIVAATSNAIVVFSLLVLQEILKEECRGDSLNLDNVFLITSAMAALGDGIQINNPPPFNS